MSVLENHLIWLKQVREDILEPDRPIVDPHHHLWPGEFKYLLEDLWRDTEDGHNILKTVFIECSQEYLTTGEASLMPVGETKFVRDIALEATKQSNKAQICGIVGHANLLLGANVKVILEAHIAEGDGLFKGIRHAGGWDHHDEIGNSHHNPPEKLYLLESFSDGLDAIEKANLSFEAWQYHHQLKEVTAIAQAHPNLKIVLNHFGGPIGIGPYENKSDEIFGLWKEDLKKLASFENVYAKLGGLAMPVNGFNFHKQDKPATSDEIIEKHRKFYDFSIEVFGPERCMFESNFPVDRQSVSYHVIWNAFKKMAANFSEEDKDYLFRKTAENFYSL